MTNTINITLKGFFPIIIHPEENEEEVKRDIGEYFKKQFYMVLRTQGNYSPIYLHVDLVIFPINKASSSENAQRIRRYETWKLLIKIQRDDVSISKEDLEEMVELAAKGPMKNCFNK